MFQVIGKVGTVVGVTDSGDLKVRYTTENLVCTLCAEAVVKVYYIHLYQHCIYTECFSVTGIWL